MPRSSTAALAGAVLLTACLGSPSVPAAPAAPAAVSGDPGATDADTLREEAQRSLEGGEIQRARELLDALVLADLEERAHDRLAADAPEEALEAVDRALDVAPDDPEVRLLKGDASLSLAEQRIRAGGGAAGLVEGALADALDSYRKAGDSAHALLGASRAAWLLGDAPGALAFARRAQPLRTAEELVLPGVNLSVERIYAEPVWAAYVRAQEAEKAADGAASAEASGDLASECLDALGRVLGRASDDAWAWARLADLYESQGELASARSACERGLKRLPADPGLLASLARVTRALDGSAAAVELLALYAARHPDVPAVRWQLALARFQFALDGFHADPPQYDPAPFAVAEAEFRGLRADFPAYAEQARGYEVMCPLARGWCAFHGGDLERARTEFLATEDVLPRGIEWAYPGELESGIQGLYLVADALRAKDDLLGAGAVFERLHGLQPDSVVWANNAGLVLRDAGEALEREGKRLCSAARGRLTNAEALQELRDRIGSADLASGSAVEREAFRRAADERFAQARALMERSWKAYRAAADLAPEDIRVVNDAALVLVYYLHHDLDWAEPALQRCIALGAEQVAAKKSAIEAEADPEKAATLQAELDLLTQAWADAHQSLGVFTWLYRKDAGAARAWLEKALALWSPNPSVTNSLLPQVRGELTPQEDDVWDLLNWAQPCLP